MCHKQISRLAALARDDTEENLGPMKLIFNYENVFYSFFYDDVSGCIHRSREYAMNYVYSGEMILDNGKEQIHVGTSLFASLTPFFDPEVKPQDDFMHLKLQEGLLALLHHIDKRFAPTLFDFSEPWKIDILDFLERNKVVDVCAKVGFRNQSHFSAAFKKQYGIAPTAVAAV